MAEEVGQEGRAPWSDRNVALASSPRSSWSLPGLADVLSWHRGPEGSSQSKAQPSVFPSWHTRRNRLGRLARGPCSPRPVKRELRKVPVFHPVPRLVFSRPGPHKSLEEHPVLEALLLTSRVTSGESPHLSGLPFPHPLSGNSDKYPPYGTD